MIFSLWAIFFLWVSFNSFNSVITAEPDVKGQNKTQQKPLLISVKTDKNRTQKWLPLGSIKGQADNSSNEKVNVTKPLKPKLPWDLTKQIGWIRLAPREGQMFVQQGLDGPLCKLGPEGPECESMEEYDSENETIPNISKTYAEECKTNELNEQREAVEAAIVPESTARIVFDQNVFLKRAFIYRALGKYDNISADQEPKNEFALLDITMSLVNNVCPKLSIPTYFLDSLNFLMKELHLALTPNRAPFISDDDFAWIKSILGKCHNRTSRDYRSSTNNICRSEVTPIGRDGHYVCTGEQLDVDFHFHEKVYDPALDAVWYMYTFVAYLCFEDFNKESIRMYHHYAQAIMDLFTAPMKLKWTNQVEPDSKTTFARLLGPYFRFYLENLERCVVFIKDKLKMTQMKYPRFYSYGSIRY